ncbi:MAG: VCBS repeat-containing protein [Gammaproteobacteria bacterium]|nr:VCBS repeat-containing protein [Gammaproteobacteria bacterium]
MKNKSTHDRVAHARLLIVMALSLAASLPAQAAFNPAVAKKLDVDVPLDYLSADLNDDGASDLVVAGDTASGSRLNILIGDSVGELKIEHEELFTAPFGSVTLGDVNNDGTPDLLVHLAKSPGQSDSVCGTSGDNVVLLGSVFEGLPQYTLGSCFDGDYVQAFDANADGNDDLLVDSRVLLSNADGTFTQSQDFGTTTELQISDVNGDGIPDVYVDAMQAFCGNGDGTFLACDSINSVIGGLLDMNGDDASDVVTAIPTAYVQQAYTVTLFNFCGGGRTFYKSGSGRGSGRYRPWRPASGVACRGTATRYRDIVTRTAIEVTLNLGQGVTSTLVSQDVDGIIQSIHVQDINGDGVMDVLASLGGTSLMLFRGKGDGSLGTPEPISSTHGGSALFMDDWNGDGLPDIGWFYVPPDTDPELQVMFQVLADSDADGLRDDDETYLYGTDPNLPDSDGDGMDDNYEVSNGLDPRSDDTALDKDLDGFSNLQEHDAGTDPSDPASHPGLSRAAALILWTIRPLLLE